MRLEINSRSRLELLGERKPRGVKAQNLVPHAYQIEGSRKRGEVDPLIKSIFITGPLMVWLTAYGCRQVIGPSSAFNFKNTELIIKSSK